MMFKEDYFGDGMQERLKKVEDRETDHLESWVNGRCRHLSLWRQQNVKEGVDAETRRTHRTDGIGKLSGARI